MNVFWLASNVDCEAVYQGYGAKSELSLVIHSDFRINFPPLPVLFAYQVGVWAIVRFSEVKPVARQFCYHLTAQSVASLHELAKLVRGNARDGFCIAASSHDSARPGLFSPQQKAMFRNYCEARANREKASFNYRKAGVGRDQANALYLETQKTWLQADGVLESIEEYCREAGFDPTCYLKDETNA